jgi:hypothetical protein
MKTNYFSRTVSSNFFAIFTKAATAATSWAVWLYEYRYAEDLDYMEKLSFAVGRFKPGHAILFQRKLVKEAKDKGFENCNDTSEE